MANKESFLRMLPTGIRQPIRKLFNSGAALTNNLVGNVTGNVTGNVVGNILGEQSLTLQSAEHGAGAIGTGLVPKTYRGYTVNGDILTSIQIDLTGLACVGTVAEDVIGLAAGGVAHIGKYVTSTYGIVYRSEFIWLEAPGQGTATITSDINITMDDDALEYDGAADGGIIHNTGGVAAGNMFVNNIPALTADDFIYIVEGDTAGTTGVYNAGQFILNLYGHPVLT